MTIPDFEELDQTSLRLAQIKVSLSTATLDHNIGKRAVPLIAGIVIHAIGIAVLRLVIIKRKEKIKEEIKEIARSAALRLLIFVKLGINLTEVLITDDYLLVLVKSHRLMEMTDIHVRISYKIYGGESLQEDKGYKLL